MTATTPRRHPAPAPPHLVTVAAGRAARRSRRARRTGTLAAVVLLLFVVSLSVGNTVYGIGDVARVLVGQEVPGASFAVGELRLPRATLALLAGAAFGAAGVTFQTLLRNPLASPDIIGISSAASAAAVTALVVLQLGSGPAATWAVVAALGTAALIYLLAYRDGVVGTRLVLIGIGLSSMLQSVVAYVLSRAAAWDLQVAMRWLTGSINNASWADVLPLALALAVTVPLLAAQARDLELLRLGDDAASAMGVRPERTRVLIILGAVVLVAFATAVAGPVAFVALLSGPIAARTVGHGGPLLLPAALVGALLVLGADLVGQHLFTARYPVGVVTGALGAPFLLYLLVRADRPGASL